jgi:hypothetical protein
VSALPFGLGELPPYPEWRRVLGESVLLLGVLLLIAAAVFGPHIVHGGLYGDDWNNYAIYKFDAGNDFFKAVGRFQAFTNFRPVLPFYVPITVAVFGRNSHLFLAWATLLACILSASFYTVLRTLGMRQLDAGVLAGLLLIFPAADSTRLWATSSHLSLAISCYFVGVTIALYGLRLSGWRAGVTHGVAVCLYLLAIWNHEMLVPAVLTSILLYRLRAPWREALRRYCVDFIVVLLTLALVTSTGPNQAQQPLGATLVHALDITYQGAVVAATACVPWLAPRHALIAIPVAVLVAALVAMRRMPLEDPARAGLRRWVLVAAGGVVAMAIGWASFAPAADTILYEPLSLGAAKRTNALAAPGVVIFVYALIQIIGVGLSRSSGRLAGKATAIALVGIALVGGGWIYRVEKDAQAWNRSAEIQGQVLDKINAALPKIPAGSTVFVGGYPTYAAPLIPAFAHYYDLDAALKARYGEADFEAYPIVAAPPRTHFPKAIHPERDRRRREDYARLNGTQFVCSATELEAIHTYRYRGLTRTPYGQALFVNLESGAVLKPSDRRRCIAAVRATPAGPYQESNKPVWPRIGTWPPLR